MNARRISVVILNYRSPWPAVKCVQHLLKQTVADQMEIILIDNHSEDDSVGILHNHLDTLPNVRIVETASNAGFGAGYNLGIAQASGEYILVNNPAKLMQPDGVEKLLQKMEQEPDIGIIAPKLDFGDGTARLSARTFPSPLDVIAKRTWLQHFSKKRLQSYLQLDHSIDEERDTDWIAGGCFMIRKDLFTQLGGFDDRFFLFFEDTDLCKRCHELGKRVVYYPQVSALDRKNRLSDMNTWKMLTSKVGRAHLMSGCKYFWKWRWSKETNLAPRDSKHHTYGL